MTTITLIADATENVTIPANANITLDLDGKTLTNSGDTTNKATLSVEGTAIVKNGTVTGGASYYNIEVKTGGNLTLEGVTATAGNTGSSMLDNWGTLTITSGTYTGGLDVVKNEPNGTLTINGGEFELLKGSSGGFTGVIFNYGLLKITEGTFKQSDTASPYGQAQVVHSDKDTKSGVEPKTEITGGTFINLDKAKTAWTVRATNAATSGTTVTGGRFNKTVFDSYMPTGYATELKDGYYVLNTAITNVTLDKTEVSVKVGKSVKLNVVSMSPENAAIKKYSCRISKGSSYAGVSSSNNTITITGKAYGDAVVIVTPAGGGSTPVECTVHVTDEVAMIENVTYPTLEGAIAAAKADQTVMLLKDTKLSKTLEINKNITLDLGENTLSCARTTLKDSNKKSYYEYIALTINDGVVQVKNGTIDGRVNVYGTANVNIQNDVLVKNKSYNSTTKGYGIVIQGTGTYGQDGCKTPVLNLYGKVNVTGTKGIGIATNAGDLSNPSINIYDGAEVSSEKNNALDLSSGTTTISGGSYSGNLAVAEGSTLKISAGYFTADPSAYCIEGKTGVASDLSGYAYMVGDKPSDATDTPAEVDSTVVPATVDKEASDVAKEVAPSITGAEVPSSDLEASVKGEADKNSVTATTKDKDGTSVIEKLNSALNASTAEENVAIVYQSYVDVTVTDAQKTDDTVTELTVNLTPMYRIVATTKEVANDSTKEIVVKTDDATEGVNAVQIGDAKKLSVPNKQYQVKLAVPTGFSANGNKVSIKHVKSNGTVEYYTGKVSVESKIGKTYVTFTTNGFSPFTIYASSASVASIGAGENEKVYPTLQAAVDAVQNGETIKILKDGETATVSGRSVNFTVKTDGKTYTINLGSNCKNNATETDKYDIVYSRPSSGSGSSVTTYAVNVTTATNGTVTADKKTAAKGATVTVTATPSAGYVVDKITVVDKDGKTVDVTATFKAETPAPSGLPFVDVKSGDWFYDAVKYAYENGLMNGTSETIFAPNGTMNRAMIMTVLYRLEKTPAVTTASQFADVPAGQWYSDAVAWAAANNIVNGYNETTFGPMNAVTREQMAAILYRYEQYKGMDTVTLEENLARFPDKDKVSAYAVPAMQWAVGQKVINGNADGTLNPTGTATRAQVAQIFTNLLNK